MKVVSLFTGVPYNIMTGTKAGVLESGQLTTSLFNEIEKQKFIDMNSKLLEKYFGEEYGNSIDKSA